MLKKFKQAYSCSIVLWFLFSKFDVYVTYLLQISVSLFEIIKNWIRYNSIL